MIVTYGNLRLLCASTQGIRCIGIENVYNMIRPWWGSTESSAPLTRLLIVTVWFAVPAIMWYLTEWLKSLRSKSAPGDKLID